MHVFICGPMRGHENLNRAAFEAARARYTAQGHHVSCLFDWPVVEALSRRGEFTQKDVELCEAISLGQLAVADIVVFLAGWEQSEGTRKEREFVRRQREMLPSSNLFHVQVLEER